MLDLAPTGPVLLPILQMAFGTFGTTTRTKLKERYTRLRNPVRHISVQGRTILPIPHTGNLPAGLFKAYRQTPPSIMKLAAPKEVTKFLTPKFLNITPPAIIYGVKIISGTKPSKSAKNAKGEQKDRPAITVKYQAQGNQEPESYDFGLTEDNYKVLYTKLGDDDAKWLNATMNLQAVRYPRLETDGFSIIADSVKAASK